MAYVKASIPKNPGAAAPVIKSDEIIIVDVDDVATEPTRAFGNTVSTGDLTLKENAKAISIKVSSHSIDCGYDHDGEVDAKGFKERVAFDYPGNNAALDNFIEAYANKGIIALVKSCDTGKTKLYGRKCNPLYMKAEPTDNKESSKTHLTFAQEAADAYLPSLYSGSTPAVAVEAVAEEGE